MAPLTSIYIGESIIGYKPKTRFLGVTVDQTLSWIPHLQEVVKSFAKKIKPFEEIKVSTQSYVRVVLFEGYPAVHYVRDASVGQRKSDGVI